MTLTPFLDAPLAIQLHALCALGALALTPFILLRRKGDGLHKMLGRVWVILMALTALSSFAITEIRLIGPYSPIHILSVVTLISLFNAVRFVRKRRISAHKKAILSAALGLVGAGLFTLLPGRLMSDVFFANAGWSGFIYVAAALCSAAIIWGVFLPAARRA